MSVKKVRKIAFYIISSLFLILIILFVISFRGKILNVIAPVLYAMPIVYIVRPLSLKLESKGLNRSISIILVYLLFVLAGVAALMYLIPELINNTRELGDKLPDIMKQYQEIFNAFIAEVKYSKWSEDVKRPILNQIEEIIAAVQGQGDKILNRIGELLAGTAGAVVNFFMALIIAFYYIKDDRVFKDAFLLLIPRNWRKWLSDLSRGISLILEKFIQGKIITSLIVAVLEAISLIILKVRYPLVLGVIGGLSNLIPYFGPFIGAIPTLAIAFLDSPSKALWAGAAFFIVQQLENSIISPKVIKGQLGLHPVATILAVIAGWEFFGILGMMLAVPVIAIIREIVTKTVDSLS
jgi:predicted PurR-regulated permease PerM